MGSAYTNPECLYGRCGLPVAVCGISSLTRVSASEEAIETVSAFSWLRFLKKDMLADTTWNKYLEGLSGCQTCVIWTKKEQTLCGLVLRLRKPDFAVKDPMSIYPLSGRLIA